MMEKESRGHALVLALTYSEETEHSRRSALMFDYKDVQELMWSVRRQVAYHLKRTSAVSFIAAGEKGDRFNRCHWHLILFSEVDLTTIGKWSASWGPVKDRSEIITPSGAKPRRRSWSLWKHGFVTVQEPDYGGMRYALAYALKDQFNVLNSIGTMREASAETFGTGYLVMSKKPPICARWIDAYVERCREKRLIPPSLSVSVGGLERPFWPSGLLATRLLAGLRSVNDQIRAETGRNGAGWSTLVHEARVMDDHLETLGVIGGEERQEQKREDETALGGLRFSQRNEWRRWQQVRRESTYSCPVGWPDWQPGETFAIYRARAESETGVGFGDNVPKTSREAPQGAELPRANSA